MWPGTRHSRKSKVLNCISALVNDTTWSEWLLLFVLVSMEKSQIIDRTIASPTLQERPMFWDPRPLIDFLRPTPKRRYLFTGDIFHKDFEWMRKEIMLFIFLPKVNLGWSFRVTCIGKNIADKIGGRWIKYTILLL